MSLIADADIRKFFEALQSRLPAITAIVSNNGMDVAVRLPAMPPTDALYIAREYNPEIDGKTGYYALTLNSLDEIVGMLAPK